MKKKIIGIMQPYFIPYLGYWQLLNAVDEYVIYDDVNYIKSGWINRNRILVNGQPSYFTIQVLDASSYKLINELYINNDPKIISKNIKTIEMAYKKAPYFECGYDLIKRMFEFDDNNLAKFIEYSTKLICEYLDIKTKIVLSSELKKDTSLKAENKVLAICKELNGTDYYNAIGGQELYSYDDFKNNNMTLHFVKMNNIEYKQFKNDFVSGLSIIDIIMFNSKEEIKRMLCEYTLIEEEM